MPAFDAAPDRPPNINEILTGLDRYNPETTTVFQDYVAQQCEERTYDAYANLALLKLYQFNPHLTRDETVTNILAKALTQFPAPDFALCLALLPPHTLSPTASSAAALPAAGDAPLSEAVQKLAALNQHLAEAAYGPFWRALEADDLYADLTADISGFEELMRVRIAVAVGQSCREVARPVLESWLRLKGSEFDKFVADICGWGLDTSRGHGADEAVVVIPVNKENEAKGTVVRENVQFEHFGRVIRRAFEQPA